MVHVALEDDTQEAHIWVGLFWDQAPFPENAVAIAMTKYDGGVQSVSLHFIVDEPLVGFTYPMTFSVRAASDAGIINVNGEGGERLMKGTLQSMLRVSEIRIATP